MPELLSARSAIPFRFMAYIAVPPAVPSPFTPMPDEFEVLPHTYRVAATACFPPHAHPAGGAVGRDTIHTRYRRVAEREAVHPVAGGAIATHGLAPGADAPHAIS